MHLVLFYCQSSFVLSIEKLPPILNAVTFSVVFLGAYKHIFVSTTEHMKAEAWPSDNETINGYSSNSGQLALRQKD